MSDPFGPISDLFGDGPASKAANAQNAATQAQTTTANNALDEQRKIYEEEVARNKPFYDAGVAANVKLNDLSANGYDMKESPSAQYALTQGTRSLNRQLAARGLLGSGNASQRLSELSSGIAANDYNTEYNRKYGALLDQVKISTGASNSAGAASQALSNNVGQNSIAVQTAQGNAGQARASLYAGMGANSINMANLGINAYRSGLFSGGSGNSYSTPTIDNYNPNTIYAGDSPGPWSAGGGV